MSEILWNIFIYPIELIVEFVYVWFFRVFENPGLAAIGVSLVISTLVLPLYTKADAIQEEERKKQRQMQKWVNHIKISFTGDERFMMLQAYYKEQNYRPIYALRSSISILLQIPFFIAAYHFLSHLSAFEGQSFLFISDLSKPDSLFTIGGFNVNILPILMTVFNIISGIIYSKGFKVSEKIQLYAVAGLFLMLLYNSPSGLVLYWTMNNLYSLVKNFVLKYAKDRFQVGLMFLQLFGLVIFGYGVYSGMLTDPNYLNVDTSYQIVFIMVITQSAFVLYYYKKKNKFKFKNIGLLRKLKLYNIFDIDNGNGLFLLSLLLITVVLGGTITSTVVSASVVDFIDRRDLQNPISLIINSLSVFAGISLWMIVIYCIGSEKTKKVLGLLSFILAISFIVNFIFFGNKLGTISNLLVYDNGLSYSISMKVINAILMIVLFIMLYYIWKNKKIVGAIYFILIISTSILTVKNCVVIEREFKDLKITISEEIKSNKEKYDSSSYEGIIPLSKNGKNVVVIMLDRAIGAYVPYMIEEKPELTEKLSGFTYYPNTLSFGGFTNFAAPAAYGGYEYTTKAIVDRDDEKMVDKHNEALLLLPKIFSDNGYSVTIIDPPYANYEYLSDLSIYENYPNVKAYNLEGYFADDLKLKIFPIDEEIKNRKRAFVYYSLTRVMPLYIQELVYDYGNYNSSDSEKNEITDSFINAYSVLNNLKYFTDIKNDDSNNFFYMHNDTTHEPCKLQLPDYIPTESIKGYDKNNELRKAEGKEDLVIDEMHHYDVNMASLLRLTEWFDYLKENDLYDNTRIILLADHGRNLNQFEDMVVDENMDAELFNPLFMVKDFNSKDFTIDNSFMTNADTPVLAMEDLIKNPVNPFTGNKINSDKKEEEQYVILSDKHYDLIKDDTTFDLEGALWYTVKDDIFNKNKWKKIERIN